MIRFTNVIQKVMRSPIKGPVKERLGMLLTELTYFRAADHPTDCRVRSEYGQLSGTVFKKPAGRISGRWPRSGSSIRPRR